MYGLYVYRVVVRALTDPKHWFRCLLSGDNGRENNRLDDHREPKKQNIVIPLTKKKLQKKNNRNGV